MKAWKPGTFLKKFDFLPLTIADETKSLSSHFPGWTSSDLLKIPGVFNYPGNITGDCGGRFPCRLRITRVPGSQRYFCGDCRRWSALMPIPTSSSKPNTTSFPPDEVSTWRSIPPFTRPAAEITSMEGIWEGT
jgi:hypothetical protein